MSVTYVARSLVKRQPLKSREFTLERLLINVMCAARSLVIIQSLSDIREFPLEGNLTHAVSVASALIRKQHF